MIWHVMLEASHGLSGGLPMRRGFSQMNRRLMWSAAIGAAGVVMAILPVAGQAAAGTAGFGFYNATRVQVGADSVAVAVDSQTDTIYAAIADGNTRGIAVIDGATNTMTADVPTAGPPVDVAVDDASDTVYVAESAPEIAVIDGATNTVTSTIDTGAEARAIAVNPQTDTIYVATAGPDPEVLVIDGQTDHIASTFQLRGLLVGAIAVDAATSNLYLATGRAVQVISLSSGQVTATIQLPVPVGVGPDYPAGGLAVDSAAGEVFAADPYTGQVSVISAASNTITGNYTAPGESPQAVAVDPATGLLFASTSLGADDFEGRLDVLNEATGAAVYDAVIPRGGASLAVDTATGAVYATDNLQAGSLMLGYVSVITPSSTATTMSPVIQNQPELPFVGFPFTFTYSVSEVPAGTVTETGALPAGLQFADGVISGTPAAGTGGQYPVQVTASNGTGPADTETYVVTVRQPITVTGPTRATLRTGRHASLTFTATGYPAPTFNTASGLPAGLTLSPSGVLSGTPAAHAGGTYIAWIGATNPVLPLGAGLNVYLTVDEQASFASARKVTFTAGILKRFTIRTWGFPAPHLTVSGKVPAGLELRLGRGGTATLSGKAASADAGHTYKLTITARNGIGRVARQVLVIRVR
jgi:DNA-binding beta-propeller fold protein YncE